MPEPNLSLAHEVRLLRDQETGVQRGSAGADGEDRERFSLAEERRQMRCDKEILPLRDGMVEVGKVRDGRKPGAMKDVLRCLVVVIVTAMTAWGAGAIYYSPQPGQILRATLVGCFVVATALAFILQQNLRRTLVGFLVAFAIPKPAPLS